MLMFFMVVVLRFAGASFCSVQLLWVQVENFCPMVNWLTLQHFLYEVSLI